MKSKLFISLSVIALAGVSIATHAAMIKYLESGTEVPKGDCLEMKCEHGCVEEDGTFVGYCCPSAGSYGQSCRAGDRDISECCQSDAPICKDGKCVECLEDASECKKCGSNNRWVYPRGPIDGNACRVCDGNGNVENVASGTLVDNNPCKKCDGAGGYSYPTGAIDGNTCQSCDGAGNRNYTAYDTPIGGNVCNVCNGAGGSMTYSTGEKLQSNGKCCVNGSLTYDDSYCPGCKDLELGNRTTLAPPWNCWTSWNSKKGKYVETCSDSLCEYDKDDKVWYCDQHFRWSDSRTITVSGKDMTLTADVIHVLNFKKYIVKDDTTGTYLVNWTTPRDTVKSTVTLQKGHTYSIEINFENLCDSCSIKAECQ